MEPLVCCVVFDTETTGLPEPIVEENTLRPKTFREVFQHVHVIELAYRFITVPFRVAAKMTKSTLVLPKYPLRTFEEKTYSFLLKHDRVDTEDNNAFKVHGITNREMAEKGQPAKQVLKQFVRDLVTHQASFGIGHNVRFDVNVLLNEFFRYNLIDEEATFSSLAWICTMDFSRDICQLPASYDGKGYRSPSLSELVRFCLQKEHTNAHRAAGDVDVTTACFRHLISLKFSSVH